jgi:hypothetical protein
MKQIPEFLTLRGAAKLVGISHNAFTIRYHKGQTPKPDGTLNSHPIWKLETIQKYVQAETDKQQ